ncbi:MAG TPA: gluconate 2-dehydrogenase subunit 3 family protein [Myxococcales bacterium]|nr:gluconate 2-dehydrogenase subunit 3 family protein [Myxococcales bacterium]
MPETRRGLLKKTVAGAALLAAAGAVPVALRKTKLREVPGGRALQFFTPAEYSIWAAVADRVLAEEKPTGPTASDLDIAGRADAFLAPLPRNDRKDLKQLLALFDNALFSLLQGGPPRTFTSMSAEDQDAHLRRWQSSRLAIQRTGYQAMKRLCCALYFSAPETYASVGYPGPPYDLVKSVLGARR